jgi:hypothetical protein
LNGWGVGIADRIAENHVTQFPSCPGCLPMAGLPLLGDIGQGRETDQDMGV